MPIVRSATSQCGLHTGRGAELAAMLGYYTIQHINQTFVSARAHIYGQYNVNWHSGTAGISIEPTAGRLVLANSNGRCPRLKMRFLDLVSRI